LAAINSINATHPAVVEARNLITNQTEGGNELASAILAIIRNQPGGQPAEIRAIPNDSNTNHAAHSNTSQFNTRSNNALHQIDIFTTLRNEHRSDVCDVIASAYQNGSTVPLCLLIPALENEPIISDVVQANLNTNVPTSTSADLTEYVDLTDVSHEVQRNVSNLQGLPPLPLINPDSPNVPVHEIENTSQTSPSLGHTNDITEPAN